ncbi:MAG: HAMP domain-containing protein, partial [Actinomycetota bacterium]|nr:HAMP domain-containing protein [Actinomycetota bacterium]
MELLPAPFHFAATFLVTVAALGGAWVTIYRPQFVPSGTWRRWAFGTGWVLLSMGELLHGAQIAPSENDPVVVTLRIAAYVLLVAAIQPVALSVPSKTDAESVEEPDDQAASDTATRPRGVHVPAVRRLVVALSLFAASEVFFLLVDSLSSEQPGGLWFFVHGLRLAGGLAVLAWLGQVVRTSIQARVVAVFIALLLVVVVAISGSMTQIFTAKITQDSLEDAAREGEAQQRLLADQVQTAISRAQQVARLDNVREAFASRSEELASLASRLQTPGGPFESSDFMAFFDPAGSILALSNLDERGRATLELADVRALTNSDVVRTALTVTPEETGREAGATTMLGPGKIAAVGAYPVANPQHLPRGLAGVVAVGRLIGERYLESLGLADGEAAFLITRTNVLASTLPNARGVIPDRRSQLDRIFERGSRLPIQNEIGGVDYFSAYVPIKDVNQRVIAALVFSKESDVLRLAQQNVATPLFFIALWATIVGATLSLLFGARITRPIRVLTDAAERVRRGDMSTRVSPKTADEVGVLGETFDQMTESLSKATHNLRETAEQELQLRRQLETILQSMTDGVVAVDHDGRIVAFNREAERILEVPQSEAIGKSIRDVLKLRDAEGKAIDPSIYDLRQGSVSGIVANVEHVARPVVVTSAPIEDESG